LVLFFKKERFLFLLRFVLVLLRVFVAAFFVRACFTMVAIAGGQAGGLGLNRAIGNTVARVVGGFCVHAAFSR